VGLGVAWRGLYDVYTPLLHFWLVWNVPLADAGWMRSLKSPVSCPLLRPLVPVLFERPWMGRERGWLALWAIGRVR
jgi:hypothetical protein